MCSLFDLWKAARRTETPQQVFDLKYLVLRRFTHGDLESRHDLSFSSHGECLVTVFFCEMMASISHDGSIVVNVQIGIDEEINLTDGAPREASGPNQSRQMLRALY
jgi:hypothetical protein